MLESKQQLHQQQSASKSSSSSGFSPEHHAHHQLPTTASVGGSPASSATKGPSVVSTSAGGIVSHQHRSASTSELAQLSPVHHHHHLLHHQQQQQHRELTLRLTQSQVSTPSMKAMTPLAMDEILQHSSSTESAQDQAERDGGRLQCPETPRRRPSKIPLAGTKGYAAPKPPTGRNFLASQQRGDKNSPSPSGSLTNKSLNKSTGSLNMKSTGPSSITSKDKKDASLNRPDSAQSWRRDTSLEKSRSSSIPVSKGAGSPTVVKPAMAATMVSSSPLPKAKRDSLTTRVKNLDSLSRFQSGSGASASTGNLSKSSSKKDLSSSFTTGQLRDRKQSSSAIRRVSSASVGRGSSSVSSGEQNNNGNGSSGGGAADTGSSGSGDNGKVRNIRSTFWNWLKI